MTLRRKLMFSLVATLLILLGLEGGARIYERASPMARIPLPSPKGVICKLCLPGVTEEDPDVQPDQIRMVWSEETRAWVAVPPGTRRGPRRAELRGEAPAPEREPGELRLLTLGDSTIWGHGVEIEDAFSSVAASRLTEALGRPVKAYIGAQPGHTTEESLRVMDVLGPQVQPDLLVVGNQWSDLFHDASPAFIEPPGTRAPLALYRVSLRLLAPFLEPRVLSWIDPSRGVGTPGAGVEARVPLPRYEANLRALAQKARISGASVAFLLLPAPLDIQGPVPAFVEDYRNVMRRVASSLGAPLVDGADRFEARGATNAWFFDSVHPNAEGHRVLGELLAEEMQARPEAFGLR